MSRWPLAPVASGGGCTGPVKGLWAGYQPRLLCLLSYLRGRQVLLELGDHLWVSVLLTVQQPCTVERPGSYPLIASQALRNDSL